MKITLLGAPKSTNHIYKYSCRGGFARSYMSADGRALKEAYQLQAQCQWKSDMLLLPVKVTATLFFGDKRVRDLDNHLKIVFDALTGVVWEDDKQIQEMTIRKDYCKENPRVELGVFLI